MKIATLICFSLFQFFSNDAFTQKTLPTHAVQLIGGYCRHGSGDLNGIVFGVGYRKYISKLSLGGELRANINDGKDEIFITRNNITQDASIRFLNASVQIGFNAGISFVRNIRHELMLSLGGFGRYQSETPDGYALYYPILTGQPTILVEFININPQETIAAGALLQLQYNYTIRNKFFIGISPALQTDTNGDIIPQATFLVGRRF